MLHGFNLYFRCDGTNIFTELFFMVTGTVFNIQKFCLHDGDGIRTCVFLKGCPLDCIWCHNPESKNKKIQLMFDSARCTACGACVTVCENRSIVDTVLSIDRTHCTACGKCADICLNDANSLCGKTMTSSEVLAEVIKDKMFYDSTGGGITLTGGEPSLQSEFALEILSLAKNAGINGAIETCGIGKHDFYEKALELNATFLFDIKCIDPDKHKKLTKADNSLILSNLEFLMMSNADIIIRLPMIPDCNDSDDDIALLADFLKVHEGKYRYAEIMPYHKLGVAKSQRLGENAEYVHENVHDDDKKRLKSAFMSHGLNVRISE